jgi:hypothetical protein
MSRYETVELCGVIGDTTAKAVKFTPDEGEPCWIPLSQVQAIYRDQGRIVVTKWIAQEKDLT